MHTPDDPTPTAKLRQTCTHPGTISATKTYNAAIHGFEDLNSVDARSFSSVAERCSGWLFAAGSPGERQLQQRGGQGGPVAGPVHNCD